MNINTMTSIERATDEILDRLQLLVDEGAKEMVNGVEKIHQVSMLKLKFATNQIVLRVLVRQRLQLQLDLEAAASCPILASVIRAQVDEMEDQLRKSLVDMGIPEKAANKQIQLAITAPEEREVVERDKATGRIQSITKQTG